MAKLEIFNSNHGALFDSLSAEIIDRISRSDKDSLLIGFCGGRSISAVCEGLLEQRDKLSREAWKKLQFFMLDERCVSLDDKDSNYRLVSEVFFSKLLQAELIDQSQVHPFRYSSDKTGLGIEDYESEFSAAGGCFDIVFLGVGEDGHVAALFPQSKELKHCGESFLVFDNSPKPPPLRMTSSPDRIKAAGVAVALFLGEAKREALDMYYDSEMPLDRCPVKLIDFAKDSIIASDLCS